MNETIKELVSKFERLDKGERDLISYALQRHFGKTFRLSADELLIMNAVQLETIEATMNGMILTKENVPDIRSVYETLNGTQLPNKVSFGRKASDK